MYIPVKLHLKNFFSHSDTVIEFENGMLVIYGINKTEEGGQSNGSGKSTVGDGLSYAISGSVLKKDVTKEDYVLNRQTNGFVHLDLVNTKTNETLSIRREVNSKKTNKVLLYENDVLNEDLEDLSPTETNKYIASVIGITLDDLRDYYILSAERYVSFFKASNTKKLDIINRFSKANVIDPVFDGVKSDIDGLSKEIIVLETRISTYENFISETKEETEIILQDNSEEVKKGKIEQLEESILSIEKIIEDSKGKIQDHSVDAQTTLDASVVKTKEINKSEKLKKETKEAVDVFTEEVKLLRVKRSKVADKYSGEIEEIKTTEVEFNSDIEEDELILKEIRTTISEISDMLVGAVVCPKCEYEFIPKETDEDVSALKENMTKAQEDKVNCDKSILGLEEAKLELKKMKESINDSIVKDRGTFDKEYNELNSDLDKISDKYNELSRQLTNHENDLSRLSTSIKTFESDIVNCERTIESQEKRIDVTRKQIESISAGTDIEENIKSNSKKIRKFEIEKVKFDEELIEIKLDHGRLVDQLEIFKRFKMKLANKSIYLINDIANSIFSDIKSSLRIKIDGFKQTKTGLKEEITATLSRDNGLTFERFGKFSAGEKTRAELCLILSMQAIINLTSESGGLNLLFIDEIADSLDEVGIRHVVNAFTALNQCIIFITHVDPNNTLKANSIVFEKVAGITRIKELEE